MIGRGGEGPQIRRIGVGLRNAVSIPVRRALVARRAARLVEEESAFRRRHRARDPDVRRYRLKRRDRQVLLRHDGGDYVTLDECFGPRAAYAPPPELAAALAARPPRSVVDLGGNIGLFGLRVIDDFPACRVTAFEADPRNAEIHERCIRENGLTARWTVERAFAAPRAGAVRFVADGSNLSHVADPGSGEGTEVAAVDVFPLLLDADLIKVDIEGAEWAILDDPRFADLRPAALVVEPHGRRCPGRDPIAVAVDRLKSAGYELVSVARRRPPHRPLGWGTIWATRS